MTDSDPTPPIEQRPSGAELRLDADQIRLLESFIVVAEQLRDGGVDPTTMDEELVYRYLGYLYEAQENEKQGRSAAGFRMAATGVALGAMDAVSPLKVIGAIHSEAMLDHQDALVLGDYISRIKRVGKQSGFDSLNYVRFVNESLEGINNYVNMNRKDSPTSQALYLIALSAGWASVREPASKQRLAERVRQFGQ